MPVFHGDEIPELVGKTEHPDEKALLPGILAGTVRPGTPAGAVGHALGTLFGTDVKGHGQPAFFAGTAPQKQLLGETAFLRRQLRRMPEQKFRKEMKKAFFLCAFGDRRIPQREFIGRLRLGKEILEHVIPIGIGRQIHAGIIFAVGGEPLFKIREFAECLVDPLKKRLKEFRLVNPGKLYAAVSKQESARRMELYPSDLRGLELGG